MLADFILSLTLHQHMETMNHTKPVKILCEEGGTPSAVTLVHALQNWTHGNKLGCYPFMPHDITRSIAELVLASNRDKSQNARARRLKYEASSLGAGAPVPWTWMWSNAHKSLNTAWWNAHVVNRVFATMPSSNGPVSLYDQMRR